MIYQGGCSFLHSPDIFVNTSLSEYIGKDLIKNYLIKNNII